MQGKSSSVFATWTLFLAAALMTSCGGGGGSISPVVPPPVVTGVTVSPPSVSIVAGDTQQFTATVTGTGNFSTAVNWSVNSIAGGNSTVGTISTAGLYTAPAAVPNPAQVNVTATSAADSTKSASAAVTINAPPPVAGPALTVNAASGVHLISPLIYGMNQYGMDTGAEAFAQELSLPVVRWGGDATTRYNYQYDITNSGADWYFESYPSSATDPLNDSQFNHVIELDNRTGTATMGTVPLVGWTTKAPPNGSNAFCGFSVAKYGPQQRTDPYNPDCGNGVKPDGQTNITGNDPADTSIPTDAQFVYNWVHYIVNRYGNAASGRGVAIWSLDNEPMLWWGTHRDVHPNPTTYDEMKTQTYTYARAVKDADPTAQTSGPALFSWRAYFYSAKDWVSGWSTGPNYTYDGNPVDRNAHGGLPFVEWYLQQMKDYEGQNSLRILDYLDVHGYVLPEGLSFQPAGDESTQAERLDSTRVLWDPAYRVDSGDIHDYVQLIPRMLTWVNNNYPGTKIAVTEYNWGALDDLNGALAQADVLGIFGREQLDLGALWGPPTPTEPGAYAFRMYRNYDGAGGQFGDTSVSAQSDDQGRLSVYAALRSADGALTLMVINKTHRDLITQVNLSGFQPASSGKVYNYSKANLSAIIALPDVATSASGFNTTFPAYSISLVVIPKQ